MAKKKITISEFREIIREETLKLKKRIVLENEKKTLEKELKSLMSESYVDEMKHEEELTSEIFGFKKEDKYRKMFTDFYEKNKKNYNLKQPSEEQLNKLVQQVIDDNNQGFPTRDREGNIAYKPSTRTSPHGAGAPGGGFSSNV